ncbi:MAG: strictosidine synthase family protein [bacterium]
MKKFLQIIVSVIILVVVYLAADIAIAAGVFKDIRPHANGTEQVIPLPLSGPEDIALDTISGMAFISVDDRRSNLARPGSVPGAILVFDAKADTPSFRNVTPGVLKDFHPHGLSIWRNPEGRVLLFVVNHLLQPAGHAVERFEWRNDSLVHLERIMDPELMTSPNDVVAVGERSFYVSNDHFFPNPGLSRTVEDYLQRAISYVNYYDGQALRTVASGIAYANGVNRSADGRRLYVAATTGRKLITYRIDSLDGSLQMENEMELATGVDNIEVDAAGDLWIGCHPQLLKFVAHAADPAKRSPSQVLRLRPQASGGYDVEEVYLNDGGVYSGSTVAVSAGGRLVVGRVLEPGLLVSKPN